MHKLAEKVAPERPRRGPPYRLVVMISDVPNTSV